MRTLEEAAREASTCTRCKLAQGRTQVVFGSGDPHADLMFIGEAPGFHEDRQGLPFVGAAGGLLTGLLEGIGLTRERVYIANVLKCRPPGNRDPQPDEIESCQPWLAEQIDLIDPKVICTLGNFSTRLLLGKPAGISRVRGQRFKYRNRVLIPTFHPAAILHGGRTSAAMGQMEDDFRLIEDARGSVRAVRSGSRRRAAWALLRRPVPDVVCASSSSDQTRAIAGALASALHGGDVVVLSGDLGAGKTTFVQGAAAALDVRAHVTSPSFVLVREYAGRARVAKGAERDRLFRAQADLMPNFDEYATKTARTIPVVVIERA